MGTNREQKKDKEKNKRTNFNNRHNSKHVRAKQAIIAKRSSELTTNTIKKDKRTSKKGGKL